MINGLAGLFAAMSLAEELYTICFTAFLLVGTVCCFVGPDPTTPAKPTITSGADAKPRG